MEMQAGAPGAGPAKTGNRLLIIIVIVILALLLLGWIGSIVIGKVFNFGVRKVIEGTTGVSIEDNGGTITFREEGGGQGRIEVSDGGGEEQKLPRDFPSNFPIMSGTKATGTFSLSSAESTSYTVNWETNASVDAAANFYRDGLSKNGWFISNEASGNGTTTFLFWRGDDEAYPDASGWVSISTDQGKTQIGLALTVYKR